MDHSLTIKDTIQLFESYGQELTRAFYDNLIQNDKITAVPNYYMGTGASYLQSLSLVQVILNKTQNFLRMVVGDSCDLLFEVLEPDFREMVKRIQKNKGFVKVIVVNGRSRFLEQLAREYPTNLNIVYATTKVPVQHFIVSDSKMLRLEEPHQPLTLDSSSDFIKATVFFNNAKTAKPTEELFDSLWEHLT